MDFKNHRYKKAFWLVLFFCLGNLMLTLYAFADSNILKNFSFDDCDPFEARARIMAVNGDKVQLVAAEQTIYVVDQSLGGQHLTTELTDENGNRMDFESFSRGQWVLVKGLKHIDGGVVALLVQKIRPPEKKRPIHRKIVKKAGRHNKIRMPATVEKEWKMSE